MPPPSKNPKNWYAKARLLARLLDEAMTVPSYAFEEPKWSRQADQAIREMGLKPGGSTERSIRKRLFARST